MCLFKEAQNNYFCEKTCSSNEDCEEGLSCENVENKELKACFTPLMVNGLVFNNDDNKPIENAFVTLLKSDDTFISDTVISDENGFYSIYVPISRDNKGDVTATEKEIFYKLRVSALNYQKYPSFIRVAIPFKLDEIGADFVYQSVLTKIALFPLGVDNLKMLSGKLSEKLAGVLVVAENKTDNSLSQFGYTGVDGNFNIVNLTSGEYKVVACKQGYNFSKEDATIADINLENVVLTKLDTPLGSVSGSVQIVNGGSGQFTSLGNKIFEKTVGKSVTHLTYDGEPLKKGYYYQWKVISFRDKQGGITYISQSEDLRGIFYINNEL